MENQEKYLSLYDYLGRAAGENVGLEVCAAARSVGVDFKSRRVQNTKFVGSVNLYPELFLKGYFAGFNIHPTRNNIINEEDLPF